MPSLATEITEITTGLGALGHDLLTALTDPPPQFVNVQPANWDNLRRAYDQGKHRDLFTTAWLNGRAFLLAAEGLRGRIPIRVEWKGPDRQVEQDPSPRSSHRQRLPSLDQDSICNPLESLTCPGLSSAEPTRALVRRNRPRRVPSPLRCSPSIGGCCRAPRQRRPPESAAG